MRLFSSLAVMSFTVLALSCEGDTSGLQGPPWGAPSFLLGSGGVEGTSCDKGVAWFQDDPHIDSMVVTFFDDAGAQRTRCGDLDFQDQRGWVRVVWSPHDAAHPSDTNRWQLKHRVISTSEADSMALLFQRVVLGTSLVDTTFEVKLRSNADAVSLRLYAGLPAATTPAVFDVSCEEGCAQHWRKILPPLLDSLRAAPGNYVHLFWRNQNWKRPLDTTEVYRNGVRVGWSGGTANTFTDGPLPAGTYAYQLRHVTGSSPHNLGGLPNSPYSAELSILLAPPPTGLTCEGNFDPTMDCRWFNAVTGDSTQVFRDGVLQATVAGGSANAPSTWTDPAVVRGASYTYQVRHVEGGLAGAFGAPVTAVANPVPPENLSCGGTSRTTATCVWIVKEPGDTVEVWRESEVDGLGHRADLAPGIDQFDDTGLRVGVTYWYKVRYRRRAEWSGFSNIDDATPGPFPEPFGPVIEP